MIEGTKNLRTLCPICSNSFSFEIEEKILKNAERFPVPFVVNHCNRTILVYVDAQRKVRGSHIVFNSKDQRKQEMVSNSSAKLLKKDDLAELSIDERTLYKCMAGCESVKKEEIPDIFEKQVLLILSKEREMSLKSLMERLPKIEKALNKHIGREGLIDLLNKYKNKDIIRKHIIGENLL